MLATASDAIIVGFQVRPSSSARKLAEREGVEIKSYSIIYQAHRRDSGRHRGNVGADQGGNVPSARSAYARPSRSQRSVPSPVVTSTKARSPATTLIRIIRDGIVVFPLKEGAVGELASLKRFKDDVKEVRAGFECGLNIKNFNDIKEGDVIEGYEIVEVAQKMK